MAEQQLRSRSAGPIAIIDKLLSLIDSSGLIKDDSNTNAAIPSSTTVKETSVLNDDINNVWNVIKTCTFEFSSIVSKTTTDSAVLSVSSTRTIEYNDKTAQTIQILEISNLKRKVIYRIISSDPAVQYSSALHEIQLFEVTNRDISKANNQKQTFIDWTTVFSNDAALSVMQDNRYKKREAFKDLQSYLIKIKCNKDLQVCVKKQVPVNIDVIWKLISNFGDLSYAETVESCTCTDNGSFRTIILKDNAGMVSERLTFMKKNEYSYGYKIVENTAIPVEQYRAVVKLTKISDNETSWSCTGDFVAKGVADGFAKGIIQKIYTDGMAAVTAVLQTKPKEKRVGGLKDKEIDEMVVNACNAMKNEITKKKKFSSFKPVKCKSQVVAGMNLFVKINVNKDEFVHARIWCKLDRSFELYGVQYGKRENDEIEYFQ